MKDNRRSRLIATGLVGATAVAGIALFIAGIYLVGWGGADEPPPTPTTTASVVPPPTSPTATTESSPPLASPAAPTMSGKVYTPAIMSHVTTPGCDGSSATGKLTGQINTWQPLTISFGGPAADEADSDPNPFLDYRLQVLFLGPRGQVYVVPGFFAGDGQGEGRGDQWQVRFAADAPGLWRYCASFRTGAGVAVELDPLAGVPTAFDGASGSFEIGGIDAGATGFARWGRLEYVGGHYLKFRDGPYWLKGGTDSPENFLGYAGFDNTIDQGGAIQDFLHRYLPHEVDWREGDPMFVSADSEADARGIIGALNYLADQHVNSIYFLPMNLGGDGQETYPFIAPDDRVHYDISKLHQWNIVMEHAQRQGIGLHVVLNENEERNRNWLDEGILGTERKLFYRELIARFGYLLALKWNLSEEAVFSHENLGQFADYIQALDWAGHPTTLHNPSGWIHMYDELLGDSRFTMTAMQYEVSSAGETVETWRQKTADAGVPWVIEMDENNPAGVGLSPGNAGWLRKEALYDIYFSGGGGIEWYLGYYDLPIGGDVNLEDFRTREAMWRYMWYARRFMEENLPFWLMEPADDLLSGETEQYGGGEVLALTGEVYAVYLPVGEPSGRLSVGAGHSYTLRWYDPRIGEFIGSPVTIAAAAEELELGLPPNNPAGDWVVLVEWGGRDAIPTPSAYP